MSRGQSHVVGVALMLAVTVVALGGITAGIGTVFESHAASADAQRVAADFDAALQPVETTGPHAGEISFSDGRLETVQRELRVLRNGSVEAVVAVDALVFRAGDHRVSSVAGAIVRGQPGGAWLRREPPIVGSNSGGILVVGAPALNATDISVAGTGRTTIETDVSHARTGLGRGTFEVRLETETPDAFARYFRAANATVTRGDPDGDGVPSVMARYPGVRHGYLVVHDMRLEAAHG